jgi:probable rRNA maturation factor
MNAQQSDDPDGSATDDLGPLAPPCGDGLTVEISDTQAHLKFDPGALGHLVRAVLAAEGVTSGTVSVAVVDDATIRQVNRRHLDHDWPTDVVSFPLSEPGDDGLTGELVVSGEMAATTARGAGVEPWDELALYVVHGLLHLCGYDDTDADDRDAMRRREGEILAGLGLTNTFAAAASEGADDGGRERVRWTA